MFLSPVPRKKLLPSIGQTVTAHQGQYLPHYLPPAVYRLPTAPLTTHQPLLVQARRQVQAGIVFTMAQGLQILLVYPTLRPTPAIK